MLLEIGPISWTKKMSKTLDVEQVCRLRACDLYCAICNAMIANVFKIADNCGLEIVYSFYCAIRRCGMGLCIHQRWSVFRFIVY